MNWQPKTIADNQTPIGVEGEVKIKQEKLENISDEYKNKKAKWDDKSYTEEDLYGSPNPSEESVKDCNLKGKERNDNSMDTGEKK